MLIVDGTLVPARDHTVAEKSENYPFSTNHQIVIDADTRLVVVVGRSVTGNRNHCRAWELSGAKAAVGTARVIGDGGYRGTGVPVPHRRERGQDELPDRKHEHNTSHRSVRARVEHVFARMKTWKILRDCRLEGAARPPRHARHRPPAQPHPRPLTQRETPIHPPRDQLRDKPWMRRHRNV